MPAFTFQPSVAGFSSQTFLDPSPVVQYSEGLHISIAFNYLLVTTTWMGGCLPTPTLTQPFFCLRGTEPAEKPPVPLAGGLTYAQGPHAKCEKNSSF